MLLVPGFLDPDQDLHHQALSPLILRLLVSKWIIPLVFLGIQLEDSISHLSLYLCERVSHNKSLFIYPPIFYWSLFLENPKISVCLYVYGASIWYRKKATKHIAQLVKNLPSMQETWIRFLGWEDPMEKEVATYSSILAWRIPWTEEPGGLQSMDPNSWTRQILIVGTVLCIKECWTGPWPLPTRCQQHPTTSQVWQPNLSPDIANCPLRG